MRAFEEAFPEALDLIARALKAGHAFVTGLKMVADEMPEPVGPEFRKTFDEQNFGLPLKDALENLTMRVPGLDVRFFATAVLIQRETGGNLSEILENLAHVVRERFKILRQVRVYTAHGRMTGYVLLALPAVLCIALAFINPGSHEPAVPRAHGADAADGRASSCRPSATSGSDRSSKSRCSVLLPLLAFVFGSVIVGGAAFALMPNRAIAIDRRLEELTSGRTRDEDDDRRSRRQAGRLRQARRREGAALDEGARPAAPSSRPGRLSPRRGDDRSSSASASSSRWRSSRCSRPRS